MIALFGGTFDPVHCGHLHAAIEVCEELGVDRIHLVLSARPAHRDAPGATLEQRWDMLQLACRDDERLLADDREIHRAGPSFTVATLAAMHEQYPDDSLVWVIGSDAYTLLPQWYEWQRVPSLASLVVLQRPGHDLELSPLMQTFTAARQVAELTESTVGEVLVLDAAMHAVSAEEIRTILAEAGRADHLLPTAVATYISQHGLYGGISDP